jgi:hypothetical protein
MKNTMKKQSPAKMLGSKAKEAIKAAVAAKKAKGTTKPVEGKPSANPTAPRGPLARAKAKAETSVKSKTPTPKPTATTKPVEGKPSSKPATKSVTKEMIGGGGVPQLRKHKR